MKYLIVFFLLFCSVVQAQPVPGVSVNGPIVPADARDLYSTLEPWYAAGVFRDATNSAGLFGITVDRRKKGMLVYTSEDSKFWRLGNDMTNWVEVFFDSSLTTGTNNIYNRDGSLTGNRTVTLGTNTLTFSGPASAINFLGNFTSSGNSLTNSFQNYGVHGSNVYIGADNRITLAGPVVTNAGTVFGIKSPQTYIDGALFQTNGVVQLNGNTLTDIRSGSGLNIQSVSGTTISAGTGATVTGSNVVTLDSPQIKVRTAAVRAGSATTNQVAKLINVDGTIEFGDSGSGLTSGDATLAGGVFTVSSPTPLYTTTAVYPDHFMVNIRPNSAAAGGESLKIGSGPSKTIRMSNGNPLPSSEMIAFVNYSLTFDTFMDAWILENPASGLLNDSTLYASVAGPVVTIGVATNAVPLNRLVQLPATTLVANPTGSTANAIPIGLTAPLSFVGTNLTISGGVTPPDNSLALVKLAKQPAATIVANPTGSTADVIPIGVVSPLSFVGTNLTVTIPANVNMYNSDGFLTGDRSVNLAGKHIDWIGGGTMRYQVFNVGSFATFAKTNTIYGVEESTLSTSGTGRLRVSPPNTGTSSIGDVLALQDPSNGRAEYRPLAYNQMPATTILGNPTGSTANAIPIGIASPLAMVGTNLTVSSSAAYNLYNNNGTLTSGRTLTGNGLSMNFLGLNTFYQDATNLQFWARGTMQMITPRYLGAAGGPVANGWILTVLDTATGKTDFAPPPAAASGTTVTVTSDYTVPAGVTFVMADATSGNITITLPPASSGQEVTIVKKDNVANIVTITSDNTSGDSFATGIGTGVIRLFLRQEFLRTRGIGGNANVVTGSQSSDLGTIADMRNFTMSIRYEFADTTPANVWASSGLSTATPTGTTLDANRAYVCSMTTGTATNGTGYISFRGGSLVLNTANPMMLTFGFQMPSTLPSAAENYIIELGVGTSFSPTGTDLSDTDCVLFRYAPFDTASGGTGKFRIRVCAGGAGNSVYGGEDTANTPTANAWYRVTLLMSSGKVQCLVNDVLLPAVTTGIPASTAMTVAARIEKGTGTTARLLNWDYFKSARTAIR